MENLFVQIFERKRRIVEKVKQQVDLHDQLLLSKCLLAGVPPPPWLCSLSMLSQPSELNKEEIITGLLFPHSRPSIIGPTSRRFPYQQPPSFLNDNVVSQQDLTPVVNNTLEEELLECDLSHNLVGHVSNANSAPRQDVLEEEGVPESVSVCCRENQSCLSPKYSEDEKSGNRLDATSPGYVQGKSVPKSVSTTGCEQKPPSPLYCQHETEADTSLDSGFPLAKIQRSRSRQKALELRSSAKASKSRSSNRKELKPSPIGTSLGIASLISDFVGDVKLSEHDGNEEGYQDKVENSNSQVERGDQCVKLSSTTNSSSPHQKGDLVQKYSSVDAYSSIVPEPLLESGHVNVMDRNGLERETVLETESHACHTDLKTREDEPPESNTITGHIDAVAKTPQHETLSVKCVSPISRNIACTEVNESHCPESSILEFFCSSSSMGSSQQQNKRRRTLDKFTSGVHSSSSGGDILDSDSVREPVNHMEEATCHNLDHYDDELQKNNGSESADQNAIVELQKMEGSASSDALRFQEGDILDSDSVREPVNHMEEATRHNLDNYDVELQKNIGSASADQYAIELQKMKGSASSDELRFQEGGILDSDSFREPVNHMEEATYHNLDHYDDELQKNIGSASAEQYKGSASADELRFQECYLFNEAGMMSPALLSFATEELSVQKSRNTPDYKVGSENTNLIPCAGETSHPVASCVVHNSDSSPVLEGFIISNDDENQTGSQSQIDKHDETEEGHQDKEENSNSQGEREDQSIKFSSTASTTNSSSPHQIVDLVPKFSSGDAYVVQEESVVESGHVKEMDRNGLTVEMVHETEPHASHTGIKEREDEPPESNTITGHIDTVAKRPRCETFSVKHVSPVSRNIACAEKSESHCQESSSSMGSSQMQNKRRRTLEKLTSRAPSSSSGGDILDSDSVRETVHDMGEAACHNLDHYDGELQKMIGSASADQYAVELQKMMGSASSDELRFQECYLFKEAGLMSPALLSFSTEQLSVKRSQTTPDHKLGSEDKNILPCAGETSHPLASCVFQDSDSSPVLEGFIISNCDGNQIGSQSQIDYDSFQLPRISAESAAIMEQICKSSRMTTPSFHPTKTFNFAGKMDVDQSVSIELLDGMYNLEGSSVFDKLCTDRLPTSGAVSSADAEKNLCISPTKKFWFRNLQMSSSSEKRASQTPELPCISEENENTDEAEHLCTTTPMSMSSEKLHVSIPDLPCIAEENENIDEISDAVNEPSDTERENAFVERKPLGNINEDAMKLLPTVSDPMILVDRDSISTAFSFSSKCDSVKSKARKQNGGMRRFTGKGKENQGGVGAGRNVKPPSSRFSKLKSSCNSSLKTVVPQLPDKEIRYNNIVSNITSFVPLVQQQKPAAPLITGKRDVKVKALEAAEASKRIAEQKENDRKMKKEAMKLERARQEQENLRKQEIEKKKKEEDRKKKEVEMAWKQEMEKKKKEEERKRKEFEMADRKRKREEEDNRLKEARRQRIADIQRQQREADQTLEAQKELKRQAKDARLKAQKELKEDQTNAEKNQRQAKTRIPEARPKSNCSDDTNASRNSRDDDFKVISNQGKMFEESYDVSPYKCSDGEEEEDEDDDDNISNHKFVPTWARKDQKNVVLGVISQQNRDPDIIFSAEGLRVISKFLLPRKLQGR